MCRALSSMDLPFVPIGQNQEARQTLELVKLVLPSTLGFVLLRPQVLSYFSSSGRFTPQTSQRTVPSLLT